MALFNADEDETEGEVRLRHPDDEEEKEEERTSRGNKLRKQAEEKLGSSSSSSSASSQLPGMGSSDTSSSISMEDIHSQNEEIIELLQEIKSELGDDEGGVSSSNELL